LLIKYIKSVFWRVAKCLSYIEEARCLKFKAQVKYSAIYVTFARSHMYCVDCPRRRGGRQKLLYSH